MTAPPARRVSPVIMRGYWRFAAALRGNHALFERLFGFRPPPGVNEPLWDWTTLALRDALARLAPGGRSLLDMGTGPVAVLAIHAWRVLGCRRVCAVDHLERVVEEARRAAAAAGARIDVRRSSLFDEIDGRFDLMTFNAPYIDRDDGARLGVLASAEARSRWSGGAAGLETVERFLGDAHAHLEDGGRVLLGVNRFYVTPAAVEAVVTRSGWRSCRRAAPIRWSGAMVHELRADERSARTGDIHVEA